MRRRIAQGRGLRLLENKLDRRGPDGGGRWHRVSRSRQTDVPARALPLFRECAPSDAVAPVSIACTPCDGQIVLRTASHWSITDTTGPRVPSGGRLPAGLMVTT